MAKPIEPTMDVATEKSAYLAICICGNNKDWASRMAETDHREVERFQRVRYRCRLTLRWTGTLIRGNCSTQRPDARRYGGRGADGSHGIIALDFR